MMLAANLIVRQKAWYGEHYSFLASAAVPDEKSRNIGRQHTWEIHSIRADSFDLSD